MKRKNWNYVKTDKKKNSQPRMYWLKAAVVVYKSLKWKRSQSFCITSRQLLYQLTLLDQFNAVGKTQLGPKGKLQVSKLSGQTDVSIVIFGLNNFKHPVLFLFQTLFGLIW